MAQFNQIRRGGYLPDKIAGQIMDQIESGELQPGDSLPTETALAEMLGVSRNVVREAIARLRSDGVVETKQGRGAIIKPFSERETFRVHMSSLGEATNLGQLFELRGVIEIQAAGIAALRRSDADMVAMQETLDAMKAAAEFDEGMIGADVEFHRAIGKATGNAYLANFSDYLSSRLQETNLQTSKVYQHSNLAAVTIAEHEAIIEAIAAQDAAAAQEAMTKHIKGAAARLNVELANGGLPL